MAFANEHFNNVLLTILKVHIVLWLTGAWLLQTECLLYLLLMRYL